MTDFRDEEMERKERMCKGGSPRTDAEPASFLREGIAAYASDEEDAGYFYRYGYRFETDIPEPGAGPGPYTLQDYYALPEDVRAELIDGRFYWMWSPRITHQILTGRIYAAFLQYIDRKKGKCLPVIGPSDVQLDMDDRTMVEPDVYIICDRSRVKEWGVYGRPDLAAEILSPSSRRKDRILKLNKYREAGVREYWIVDPEKRTVTVHLFSEDGGVESRTYDGTSRVPVGIYEGECTVDFGEIFGYIDSLHD